MVTPFGEKENMKFHLVVMLLANVFSPCTVYVAHNGPSV